MSWELAAEKRVTLSHSCSRGWVILRRKSFFGAADSKEVSLPEKIHCTQQALLNPCQSYCPATPWGNALVSIYGTRTDTLACAVVITRLVSAQLWVRLVLTGDSPVVALVFPRTGTT